MKIIRRHITKTVRQIVIFITLFSLCLSPVTYAIETTDTTNKSTENTTKYSPQTDGIASPGFQSSNKAEFWDNACGGTSGSSTSDSSTKSTSGSTANLKKTYVLGDSITLAAKSEYEAKLKEAGAEDVLVSASGGGNLASPGTTGTLKSGFDAIESDKDFIKDATTVIIAHGTNQMKHGDASASNYIEDQSTVVAEAITKIKDTGAKANIYWVDVAITKDASANVTAYAGKIDQVIYKSQDKGYTVVSWAKAVDAEYKPAEATGPVQNDTANLIQPDGVHPTTEGVKKLVETVVNGVKNGSSTANQDASASSSSSCCADSGSSVQLAGKDNTEKVLNFFMSKGLTLAQASGFVGNMMQESGVDPKKIQGGAIADDSYQMQNGVGFGLIQWTFSSRQEPLKKKAASMKTATGEPRKIYDIEVQLEYIWDELNSGYKHTLAAVKSATSPVDAAIAAHGPPNPGYEASADSADKVRSVRGGNAQKVYDKYKDSAPSGTSSSSDGATKVSDASGATTTSSSSGSSGGAMIAIDPGHSVPEISDKEETTGAVLSDYPNGSEVNDMWDVGQKVKTGLEKKGFKVTMLRSSKEEKVNFKERAERAKSAGAAMALSLHSTVGKSEVFDQFVGGQRTGPNGTKKFENADTATKSSQYSEAMAKKRTELEGHSVTVGKVNFDSRGGDIASGNLAWVELLSADTPWVYNEYSEGGRGGAVALTDEDKTKYAEAVVEGVVAANPQGGGTTSSGSCGDGSSSGGGDLSSTVQKYAWKKSDPKAGSIDPKPDYAETVKKSKAAGLYVGGISHVGIDCGGFVTLLLRDSGYEKGYNFEGKGGPTSKQEEWMQKNWEKIGSGPQDPAKLKAGDVAINSTHTFVFVGDVGGDFGSNIASASLDDRAPQAGGDDANESGFNWYRKK